tara:strand:+ start:206 stop:1552 length:1347 start_codon:yes stop_codon:yes gene_type:complete
MNVKEINSKKLYKEYEIIIPYEEVDKLINEKINEIIPTVSLPGFRKGKAPQGIVRKKYENNVLNEIIEKIVQDNTKKLLEEKKLKAFRQPKVELKKYEKNQPVEIIIKIDLDPSIKIFPFSDLELIKRTIDLDKEAIDQNYKNFINSQKHYHKVEDSRSIKLSDKIIANISTEDESVPEFLRKQENLSIITDSDFQVLPDISKKLINKKVKIGDKIKLKFDLKEVLKEKNKKEVEFLIEIISLEHPHEFTITKEFLDQHKLKDEKELKDNLKKSLINQYENYLSQIQRKELMDILDAKNKFDVPEGILDDEFKLIWHRLENAKKENKLDEDDKNLSEDKLKERYKKIAFRRVKLAILMQHIASESNITISEKELTDGMINYASQYPGQEKQIFEYFKKNPSSVESIRGPIFEQKIVDFIFSKVKLKNKKITIKDFNKLQENTFNNKDE